MCKYCENSFEHFYSMYDHDDKTDLSLLTYETYESEEDWDLGGNASTFYILIDNNKLVVTSADGDIALEEANISYCPMCGRRLDEKQEEEIEEETNEHDAVYIVTADAALGKDTEILCVRNNYDDALGVIQYLARNYLDYNLYFVHKVELYGLGEVTVTVDINDYSGTAHPLLTKQK